MQRTIDRAATVVTRRALAASMWLVLAAVVVVLSAPGALASCFPVVWSQPATVLPVRFEPTALASEATAKLTFLGHSSFLIESAGGTTAVTDFNGYVLAPQRPDIVTMNNAHSSHYTDAVDPQIEHVLRGWGEVGAAAEHDVTLGDMRVRNVPTNVRDIGGVRYNGNSIFVFEILDLCIAHLGHLHQRLSEVHLAELGVIDVLLVPVDGVYTMSQDLMVEVVEQIRPSVIVPMHYFNQTTLGRFLALLADDWQVEVSAAPSITLSRLSLPYRRVLVLPGY